MEREKTVPLTHHDLSMKNKQKQPPAPDYKIIPGANKQLQHYVWLIHSIAIPILSVHIPRVLHYQ